MNFLDDIEEAAIKKARGQRKQYKLTDFVYDLRTDRYWNLRTMTQHSAESVNAAVPRDAWETELVPGPNGAQRSVKIKPASSIARIERDAVVESVGWWPGMPQIVHDVVVADEAVERHVPDARMLAEASALYHELSAANNQFGDARDEKLSAEGYLREALYNARTTLKAIAELDKLVEQLPPDDVSYNDMRRFIGNVYAAAVATRMDQGVALRPVVGNLHRMVDGDPAAYVTCRGLGSSVDRCPNQRAGLSPVRRPCAVA